MLRECYTKVIVLTFLSTTLFRENTNDQSDEGLGSNVNTHKDLV